MTDGNRSREWVWRTELNEKMRLGWWEGTLRHGGIDTPVISVVLA